MHFALRCCDISSLAGRNIFRSRNIAIRRLVDAIVNGPAGPMDTRANRELVSTLRKGDAYQRAVQCNKLTPEICTSAEQECRDIVGHYSRSGLAETSKLYRRYQHLYLKDRGLVIEQLVINQLKEQGHNILPLSKRERSFCKTFSSQVGDHTYTIYGCVDCIEECPDGTQEGTRSLMEIKSRKNQQLHYTHEQDQVVTYLVISGYPRAYLVEYLSGGAIVSRPISLGDAESIWDQEIRQPLENSLDEAAAKILQFLP